MNMACALAKACDVNEALMSDWPNLKRIPRRVQAHRAEDVRF